MLTLEYLYLETPSIVRITSSKLCLDHTFYPLSSHTPISFKELYEMANSDLYDSVNVFIDNNCDVISHDSINNEDIKLFGWISLKEFDNILDKK